ncbi:carboxypeptidase-like regulatory domain-containing protein [soil metagenome]
MIILASLVCPVEVLAQHPSGETFSYEFRGEPLDMVLDRVARDTGTDLVYDPLLVSGAEVYKRLNNQTVQGILRMVLTEHGLDYLTLSSGTIVIVRVAAEDPAYGTFSGTIVDSRTGEPLPGATIMLADASGGTSAGRTGNFSMSRLMNGEHTITFSYIGYEAVTKTVRIPPNEQVRERIELRPKSITVLPVVVEAHRPEVRSGGNQSDQSGDWQAVGLMKSPIRDLSLFPGVQHGLPMGGLHLQGGQQSEHRMQLDGAPVYNPYSIGQMFSSFSPQAIGRATLHQAGFGAVEGSRIAGVIDLSHEMPPQGYKGATLQADPLSVNVRGDLSFELEDDASFSIMSALRTNYWDTYKDPVLERTLREWDRIDPLIINQTAGLEADALFYTPADHQSEVDFYDLHVASQYRFNPFQKISASYYSSQNRLGTAVLNRAIPGIDSAPYLYAAEQYNWKNRVGQISWSNLLTPRTDINTQFSYSYGSFRHGSETGTGTYSIFPGSLTAISADAFESSRGVVIELPSQIEGNSIGHFIAKTDVSYSFNSTLDFMIGVQFERISSSVDMDEGNYLPTFANVKSSMISSHLTGNYRFGNYWHLSIGSRFTWLNENISIYAEPRASIQYDRPDSRIGYWSARLSGGLYRQFVNEYNITNTGASAVVPSFSIWSHAGTTDIPKAYHLNGSWYAEFSEESSIRLEAFYKWQPVTNITSYRNLISGDELNRSEVNAFAESAEMTALGAGIRVNQSVFDSRVTLMAGYDYSFTRLDLSSQFDKTVPAPWNEPHRAQFRILWHLLTDLTLAGKWQGTWGRRWAFRDSYYNFLQVANPQIASQHQFGNPETDRLGAFSQADISVIYQPSMGQADLELRLDFVNILNRRNPLDRSLLPVIRDGEIVRYETTERTMPGFYPTISVQLKF